MVHRSDQRAPLTLKVPINSTLWGKFQFFIGKKLELSNNIKGARQLPICNKFVFRKNMTPSMPSYATI